MREGTIGVPRQAVQFVLHAHLHQLMPGGVKLDLVDAVAVAVVGAQHRLVLVGQPAPLLLGLAADELAELRGPLEHPLGALALGGLDQRAVAGEDVHVHQRGHLVGDRVRLERRRSPELLRHRAGHRYSIK